MTQFMLLLHERPSTGAQMAPAEIQAVIQEYRDWSNKVAAAGKLVGGQKLTNDAGKAIRPGANGGSVTDGPYSETKEVIGGFFLINAADYGEAVETAKTCPHVKLGGGVEVRQIDDV